MKYKFRLRINQERNDFLLRTGSHMLLSLQNNFKISKKLKFGVLINFVLLKTIVYGPFVTNSLWSVIERSILVCYQKNDCNKLTHTAGIVVIILKKLYHILF